MGKTLAHGSLIGGYVRHSSLCSLLPLKSQISSLLNPKEGLLRLRIPWPKGADYCNVFPDRRLLGTRMGKARGGVLNNVLCGEVRPEVQPLYPFLYHIWLKRYPFCRPFIDKWYSFHIPHLELCIPFLNCCKCTVFKIWINHKTRTFFRLFHSHKIHLVALLGLLQSEMIDLTPFQIPTPYLRLKKAGTPFGGNLPV